MPNLLPTYLGSAIAVRELHDLSARVSNLQLQKNQKLFEKYFQVGSSFVLGQLHLANWLFVQNQQGKLHAHAVIMCKLRTFQLSLHRVHRCATYPVGCIPRPQSLRHKKKSIIPSNVAGKKTNPP